MSAAPLIGVTACARQGERHVFHSVATQYIEAVVSGVGGMPLIVPALGARTDFDSLVARLDGLLLTGSPSNVEPHRYGAELREGTLHDPARDETTLPLIRRALADGLPLLALCRGHQELNVALGGTCTSTCKSCLASATIARARCLRTRSATAWRMPSIWCRAGSSLAS